MSRGTRAMLASIRALSKLVSTRLRAGQPARAPRDHPAGHDHQAATLVAGAHARRCYARPDIAYVPATDAPSLERGPIWPTNQNTVRVRAVAAAGDLIHDHTAHSRVSASDPHS